MVLTESKTNRELRRPRSAGMCTRTETGKKKRGDEKQNATWSVMSKYVEVPNFCFMFTRNGIVIFRNVIIISLS